MKIRRNLFFSAAAIALALCLAGGAVNITAAPQQQQGTRNLVVTVQVSTPDGQHLNGARVNIYVGYTGIATLGTDSRVRPPDFQDLTNPQGIVQFKGIPVKPGADLGITFEISRDDIETIRQDVDFGTSFPDRLPPQKFKLVPKGAHASINMRFKVMDGDDEPREHANRGGRARFASWNELSRTQPVGRRSLVSRAPASASRIATFK